MSIKIIKCPSDVPWKKRTVCGIDLSEDEE
jgi:hypothetical protein